MRIHPLLAHIVTELMAGVDVSHAAGPDRDVDSWSNRDVLDFIDHTRRVTGDEYMGLAADRCGPGAADYAMELGARCATLHEAIDSTCRFLGIATRAFVFTLHQDEARGIAVLQIARQAGDSPASAALVDWIMIAWHKLMQWLIGSEVPLDRAEFDHPLTIEYRHYASMFGGQCLFNQNVCALAFDRALLDRKVIRQPWEARRLKETTPGYFEQPGLLARSWSQKVRNVMRSEIAAGNAPSTTDALAAEFGIGTQTLRRRLAAEGTNMRRIKAEVRLEIARDMLAKDGTTLGEASLAAGFSEPNALARALRLSRGLTASQIRAEMLAWRKADQ